MEDALVPYVASHSVVGCGVLILVLMEDALVPTDYVVNNVDQAYVLILVLMEDALVRGDDRFKVVDDLKS